MFLFPFPLRDYLMYVGGEGEKENGEEGTEMTVSEAVLGLFISSGHNV